LSLVATRRPAYSDDVGIDLLGSLERSRTAKIAALAQEWGWTLRQDCEMPVIDPPLELLQRGDEHRCAQAIEGVRNDRHTLVFHWAYRHAVEGKGGGSVGFQEGVAGLLDLAADAVAKQSRPEHRFVVLSRLVVLMQRATELPALRVDAREEIAETGLGWYPFDKRYTIVAEDDSFAAALMQDWLRSWLRKQRYASFELRGRWVAGVRVTPRVGKIGAFVGAVDELCNKLPARWDPRPTGGDA
jgi:hypothetical protein